MVAMTAPSTLIATEATATLSEAVAETETVPDTVAPERGAPMLTVGGVVSGGAVTVSPVDPLTAPEVAVMVALPVAAPVARPAAVIVAFALLELHVTEPVRFCVLLSL